VVELADEAGLSKMLAALPGAAFIISLIGGIIILIGGALSMSYGFSGSSSNAGVYGNLGLPASPPMGSGSGSMWLGVLGVVFGIIVIISAVMLTHRPEQHLALGTAIVIFSGLSIVQSAFTGFSSGLVLGVMGGILAIIWKPIQTRIA